MQLITELQQNQSETKNVLLHIIFLAEVDV